MSKVLDCIKTTEGRAEVNEALAAMCRIEERRGGSFRLADGRRGAWPPRFLAGLLPDGSCDEEAVDGALLWRVMLKLKDRCGLQWHGDRGWYCDAYDGLEEAYHPHLLVALALVAEALGILWGEKESKE